MDCYVEAGAAHALPALRRELVTYLRRHGDPGSDFDAAELLIGEAVGNAVRHTAGPAWVSLHWRDQLPLLTVHDLGPGFDPASLSSAVEPSTDPDADPFDSLAESGRGLMIMRALAPTLTSRARTGEGMVVSVSLPVTRPSAVSHDPPMRSTGALPLPEESLPQGGFGKESFLRALVVQLAQAVERTGGPALAEAAVAQVAIDVGSQMEAEYRAATGVVDRLDPAQLADCFVRLKHAIDGGFVVLEVTDDRIVLGNDRCPFGDVVRLAPALCRMTSAVFGGIAAGNQGEAAVTLEERIAVGDPGCRVVIELGPQPLTPAAHHYRTHRPTSDDAVPTGL